MAVMDPVRDLGFMLNGSARLGWAMRLGMSSGRRPCYNGRLNQWYDTELNQFQFKINCRACARLKEPRMSLAEVARCRVSYDGHLCIHNTTALLTSLFHSNSTRYPAAFCGLTMRRVRVSLRSECRRFFWGGEGYDRDLRNEYMASCTRNRKMEAEVDFNEASIDPAWPKRVEAQAER